MTVSPGANTLEGLGLAVFPQGCRGKTKLDPTGLFVVHRDMGDSRTDRP